MKVKSMNNSDISYDEFIKELMKLFYKSLQPPQNEEEELKNQYRIFAIEQEILSSLSISEDMINKVENADTEDPEELKMAEELAMNPLYMRFVSLDIRILNNYILGEFACPITSTNNYNEMLNQMKEHPERIGTEIHWAFSEPLIHPNTARVLYEELLIPYYLKMGALQRKNKNGQIEPYFPLLITFDDEHFLKDKFNSKKFEFAKEYYLSQGLSEKQFNLLIDFLEKNKNLGIAFAPKEAFFLEKILSRQQSR